MKPTGYNSVFSSLSLAKKFVVVLCTSEIVKGEKRFLEEIFVCIFWQHIKGQFASAVFPSTLDKIKVLRPRLSVVLKVFLKFMEDFQQSREGRGEEREDVRSHLLLTTTIRALTTDACGSKVEGLEALVPLTNSNNISLPKKVIEIDLNVYIKEKVFKA